MFPTDEELLTIPEEDRKAYIRKVCDERRAAFYEKYGAELNMSIEERVALIKSRKKSLWQRIKEMFR